MKNDSSGATLIKTKSSGAAAGAMLMKRKAPETGTELCHFCDGHTALVGSILLRQA